jgi:hypothetical protein
MIPVSKGGVLIHPPASSSAYLIGNRFARKLDDWRERMDERAVADDDEPRTIWQLDLNTGVWKPHDIPEGLLGRHPDDGGGPRLGERVVMDPDPSVNRLYAFANHVQGCPPPDRLRCVVTLELGNLDAGWVPVESQGTVPQVNDAKMAFDANRRRLVLLGGYTTAGNGSQDVYAFELSGDGRSGRWTKLAVSGTRHRVESWPEAMVVAADPAGDRMFVATPAPGGSLGLDELTFTDDGGTWRKLPDAATVPGVLAPAFHWDAAHHRLLLWGGEVETAGKPVDQPQLRSLDPDEAAPVWKTITTTSPPPYSRAAPASFWDPERSRIVVFGGGSDRAYEIPVAPPAGGGLAR